MSLLFVFSTSTLYYSVYFINVIFDITINWIKSIKIFWNTCKRSSNPAIPFGIVKNFSVDSLSITIESNTIQLSTKPIKSCNAFIGSTDSDPVSALDLQIVVKCLHWLYRKLSNACIGFTEWSNAFISSTGSSLIPALGIQRVVQCLYWF